MGGNAGRATFRLDRLARAIGGTGSRQHVNQLIDLIGSEVRHDRVTVVRYSTSQRPEFISHRNYSDAMVSKYLENYYVHDPFYAHWRKRQRTGVVLLRKGNGTRRGPYISEFLGESRITDEIGVLLEDGPGWCLGIFLERKSGSFSAADFTALKKRFRLYAALHALDIQSRAPGFRRTSQPARPGLEPVSSTSLSPNSALWPELSRRECEIVQLALAGYPTAGIAQKLGIAHGTVKNHRRNIYAKLDITTERELFLQYLDRMTD
jgi:DNA-binding CsgD family transcriptional regulator